MTTVNHNTFGIGQVISEENGNVTVDFNGSVKTLVTKYARLTNEDGTAYGVQAVAKETKKISKRKVSEKLAITAHSNGMTWQEREELEAWIEKQKRSSHSTF